MDHDDHHGHRPEPRHQEARHPEAHAPEHRIPEQHGPDHSAHDHTAHDHTAHDHSTHDHSVHAPAAGWGTAVSATLHCLTGCAVGEVLGMVIGTALGWHGAATIVLAVALAFAFGYAFTMRGLLRSGMAFGRALKIALAADTVSIAVMEIVDNAFMLAIPGAMEAGLADLRFWLSLAAALALAFVLTVPVNRWLIARGKGHAVVHGHHH